MAFCDNILFVLFYLKGNVCYLGRMYPMEINSHQESLGVGLLYTLPCGLSLLVSCEHYFILTFGRPAQQHRKVSLPCLRDLLCLSPIFSFPHRTFPFVFFFYSPLFPVPPSSPPLISPSSPGPGPSRQTHTS